MIIVAIVIVVIRINVSEFTIGNNSGRTVALCEFAGLSGMRRQSTFIDVVSTEKEADGSADKQCEAQYPRQPFTQGMLYRTIFGRMLGGGYPHANQRERRVQERYERSRMPHGEKAPRPAEPPVR